MEEIEYDTYDPILYMRTIGLLEPDVSVKKYDEFIEKMNKKLNIVNNNIADYVERHSKSFIDLFDKIKSIDSMIKDTETTHKRFSDYTNNELNKNEEIYLRIRHEYNQRVQSIESKIEAKRELEDVLYIDKHITEINQDLSKMTNEEIIVHFDYSKIEKLSRKVDRLKNSPRLQEDYLYSLDEILKNSNDLVNKICHILVQEFKSLIQNSSFFTKEGTEGSLKDSRKVFMILKSFKQLKNCEEYIYRTINNEIVDPEFKTLVDQALKSKSVISLNDEKFDKTNLPLIIFMDGAIKLFQEGSLKNLIKMCHGKHSEKYKPLSKDVHISGYNIILNCIVKPIFNLFETKLSFVYSPGIPIIFHSNYRAVQVFIKTITDIDGESNDLIIKKLLDKFNLTTYYTLVAREVIKDFNTKIESVFSKGKIESDENSISSIVISTVSKCIGDDIFLVEIADKILTICIQIIIRLLYVAKENINK